MQDLRPRAADDRRLLWTSRMAMALAILTGCWGIGYAAMAQPIGVVAAGIGTLGFAAVPWLARHRHGLIAQALLLIIANAVTGAFTIILGRVAGVQAGFYVLVGLPLVVTRRDQRLLRRITVLLPVVLHFTIRLLAANWPPFIDTPVYIQYLVAASVFLASCTLVHLLYGTMAETEGFYEQILDTISDLVLVKRPLSRIQWANKAFLDYYGMSNTELRGQIDAPLVAPDFTERYVRDDHYVATGRARLDILDEPVRRRDGVIRYFHTVKEPIVDALGQVRFTVGVSRDITERKAAEDELEKSIRRFRSIFDNTAVGILVVEAAGCIGESNQTVQTLLGFDAAELKGKRLLDLTHPDDRIWQASSEEFPNASETRLLTKQGAVVWGRITASVVRTGDGDQTIALIEDIGRRKAAEAKMISASKMSALGEMAAGIAHEINNPLAIILGRAMNLRQQLEGDGPDLARARAFVSNIEATAGRIELIIRGLTTFARTADGDAFSVAPLRTIIEDTLALCGERLRNAGIDLRVHRDAEEVMVECRPSELSQVLLNLIGNAFDAVLEGALPADQGICRAGPPLTRAPRKPNHWIEIRVRSEGDRALLCVSNSGPSVPEELAEKIFQPFFTTKPVGKGTGLGLSISRGIVEAHHGTLRLDTSGPPTCFTVDLRRAKP